jgi:hypothetical protein
MVCGDALPDALAPQEAAPGQAAAGQGEAPKKGKRRKKE